MKPLDRRNRKLWTLMALIGMLFLAPQGIYAEEVTPLDDLVENTEDQALPELDESESENEIPVRDNSEPGMMTWIAMLLLGGAAFGALILSKKKQKAGTDSRPLLSVLNTVRIGGKHQLSLIEVPGKLLVIGVTEKGLTTLTEIPQENKPQSADIPEETETKETPKQNAFGEELVHDDPEENRALMDRILHLANRKNSEPIQADSPDLTDDSSRREVLRRLEAYKEIRVSS
jgi:flagellar biogenesis protein FliO